MRKIPTNSSSATSFFSNRLILLIWIIGCSLVGIRLIRSAQSTKSAYEAKKHASDQLRLEEEKNVKLLEELENASSPLEEERRIRNELNLQKPGEIILQLPSPSP